MVICFESFFLRIVFKIDENKYLLWRVWVECKSFMFSRVWFKKRVVIYFINFYDFLI